METYTITKGHKYDRGGALVGHGTMWSCYAADGKLFSGEPASTRYREQVAEAVQRVIATGMAETLTIGEPVAPVAEPSYEPCPHYTSDQGCPLHGETCR